MFERMLYLGRKKRGGKFKRRREDRLRDVYLQVSEEDKEEQKLRDAWKNRNCD